VLALSLLLNLFSLVSSGVDAKVSGGAVGQTSPLGRLRSRTVTGSHTANNAQQIDGGLYRMQLSQSIGSSSNNCLPSTIGNSRCFTFLLADHTSNQYGVCLLLPRTFRDSQKSLLISCDYCVCVVTTFPFLGLLFNLLLQFDAIGGFDFSGTVKIFCSVEW
jgi:hypothetical protein